MIQLRQMTRSDIPSVLVIQEECYVPDAIESEAVIRARLEHAPSCAWVAEDAQGICAYLVGYPSELGKVTPLGGNFAACSAPACLYLHDLAVARRVAGQGVGSRLVGLALDAARRQGLRYSALVSVQQSAQFWCGLGYAQRDLAEAAQAAHLGTYPGPACYMVRDAS